MSNVEQEIFRRGSTTYYFSSIFFPPKIRVDVFRLYSFVRIADNYVDEQPTQPERLLALEQAWLRAKSNPMFETKVGPDDDLDLRVIKNLVFVARKYQFDPVWVEAFLAAMKADISPQPMADIDEVLNYVHGSAEVVGLMMARIMGLSDKAMQAAAMQGRAMQYINFIRDIAEDVALGRQYFAADELAEAGLADLSELTARQHPEAFRAFVRRQLERYATWQDEASAGFRYIPRRYRVAIRTAVDMYNWTGRQIAAEPLVVYQRKVKPAKWRVLTAAARRMVVA